MAEDSRSYPFSAGDGATVTERDWGDMAFDWGHHSGVRPPGPFSETAPLRVVRSGANTVAVSPGRAKVAGYHYRLNSEAIVEIPHFTADNRERVDYVGPTVDARQPIDPGSSITLQVRTGSEATPGNAVAPTHAQLWDAHTQTPGLWDLPLARVRSRAGEAVRDEENAIVGYRAEIITVEDQRRYLGSDVLYAGGSSVLPLSPADGQLVWRADNRQLTVYDGASGSYAPVSQVGAALSYTPQVSGLSAGYSAAGRYMMIADKLCWVSIRLTTTRAVRPNSTTGVRLYLPVQPRSGGNHNNPINFHQYSGADDEPNMTIGHAIVNAGGYLNMYAPDPNDSGNSNWELDTMDSSNPGTCLLRRAGAVLSLSGIYETR